MTRPLLPLPTTPTLYHQQYFSSSRPLGLLMELGIVGMKDDHENKVAPITVQPVTHDQLKNDPILTKLNPQRRLPFFFDPTKDNLSLNESGGLVQYLLETYDTDHKMHPAPGDKTRPEFLKLIHFGSATAYHVVVPLLFPQTLSDKQLKEKKQEWHEIVAPTIEQALEKYGGPYLLGNNFTAADVVVGYDVMTASFTGFAKELLGEHPQIQAYHDKISTRPVYKDLYTPPQTENKRCE